MSFSRILKSYGLSIRSWILETGIPIDPIGSPEHRKNDLDEVQAGSGTMTYPECCVAPTVVV